MSDTATSVDLEFLRNADNLPALPAVALEVIRLTQQEEVDLEEIGETVGRDPALAARLVKLSNSPLFGRAQEVTSINQALMVLGLKAVKMAAISCSMGVAMSSPDLGYGRDEDYRSYWRRSVTAAVASKQLLSDKNRQLADEGFLCGLLMDVGFPTLLRSGHEPYRQVMSAVDSGHADPIAEREALDGAAHSDVSAHVLRSWDLPEVLTVPISWHHDPDGLEEDVPEDARILAKVLNFAHDIATIVSSEDSRGTALKLARKKAEDWYDLVGQEFDEFLKGLTENVHGLANLMDVDVGSPEEMAKMMMQAQEDMLVMAVGANQELERTQDRLKQLAEKAETDALTRIRNRAAYDDLVAEHWRLRTEEGDETSIGLIMVDVDKFKVFNDTFGHQAGDEVLKHVAEALSTSCRTGLGDVVCRYGGEEFVTIVPGVTVDELGGVAERLRRAVEDLTVATDRGILKVTASFGAAHVARIHAGVTSSEVLELADQNLYAAKDSGRNRCVVSAFPQD